MRRVCGKNGGIKMFEEEEETEEEGDE